MVHHQIQFNQIYVIQSLPRNDIPTGKQLHDDIIRRKISHLKLDHEVKSEFVSVFSKEELTEALKTIASKTQYNVTHPYLHFEMHGKAEGLELENKELITWEELNPLLTNINLKTKNNLFVSVTACFGAFLSFSVNPTAPTPFIGYVGYPKKISQGKVESDWSNYFVELLETQDINLALEALMFSSTSNDYIYRLADELFEEAAEKAYSLYSRNTIKWENLPNLDQTAKMYASLLSKLGGSGNFEDAIKATIIKMAYHKIGVHKELKNNFMIKIDPPPSDLPLNE